MKTRDKHACGVWIYQRGIIANWITLYWNAFFDYNSRTVWKQTTFACMLDLRVNAFRLKSALFLHLGHHIEDGLDVTWDE